MPGRRPNGFSAETQALQAQCREDGDIHPESHACRLDSDEDTPCIACKGPSETPGSDYLGGVVVTWFKKKGL